MVKLIRHTGECSRPDDESLPVKLELIMRSPSLMAVAFVAMHSGTKDVVSAAEGYVNTCLKRCAL